MRIIEAQRKDSRPAHCQVESKFQPAQILSNDIKTKPRPICIYLDPWCADTCLVRAQQAKMDGGCGCLLREIVYLLIWAMEIRRWAVAPFVGFSSQHIKYILQIIFLVIFSGRSNLLLKFICSLFSFYQWSYLIFLT